MSGVQKMSSQRLLQHVKDWLAGSGAFTSFPFSVLLFGLEALIDSQFECPCKTEWNRTLYTCIVFIPPCFAFMLMFLCLRPFKAQNWTTFSDCLESLLHCLIPPVVWVFLLLHDGDYFACGATDWDGVYVYDDELTVKWCKPTGEDADIEAQRNRIVTFLLLSQVSVIKCTLCCCFFKYKIPCKINLTYVKRFL